MPIAVIAAMAAGHVHPAIADDVSAVSEFFKEWNISGSNTARLDYYNNDDDASTSPFTSENNHYFDELSINAFRRQSAYDTQRIRLEGAYSQSAYRGVEDGGILQSGAFTWEKGDAALPFRMDVGDFFAFQSPRTVQRALKGVQVDLQPSSGDDTRFYSIQAFSGFSNPIYRNVDVDKDFYNGLSLLAEDDYFGAVSLNTVLNFQDRNTATSTPTRHQQVSSIGWGRSMNALNQKINLEAEYGIFNGDILEDGTYSRQSDDGYTLGLDGKTGDLPLSYELTYDRYGKNYQPRGGSISADTRQIFGRASWRFENGLNAQVRQQVFTDSVASLNPTKNVLTGINLSGPILKEYWAGTNLSLGSSVQRSYDKNDTSDRRTKSLNANLSFPIYDGLNGRVGYSYLQSRDRIASSASITRQLTMSATQSIQILGMKGSFTPNFVSRTTSSASSTQSAWDGGLSISLSDDVNQLSLTHTHGVLDPRATGTANVSNSRTALEYSYTYFNHRVGLSTEKYRRDANPGTTGNAYRIGVFWKVNFDNSEEPSAVPALAAVPGQQFPDELDIFDLIPGLSFSETAKRLQAAGIDSPIKRNGIDEYETVLFDDITQSQRFVVKYSNQILHSSSVIIDFTDANDPDLSAKEYDEIRNDLVRRFGSASAIVEQGDFTSSISNDIQSNVFIRMIEWQSAGGTVRFGIPKRLDGIVRMELHHSRDIPQSSTERWGFETVR